MSIVWGVQQQVDDVILRHDVIKILNFLQMLNTT